MLEPTTFETGIVQTTDEKLTHGIRLTDIYTEEGEAQFKDALTKSGGSAILLVHPYCSLYKEENAESLLLEPRKWKLKKYVDELRQLIQNALKQKTPVFILERTEAGVIRRDDPENQLVAPRLTKNLQTLAGLETGNIFYTITNQGSPVPLLPTNEVHKLIDSAGGHKWREQENLLTMQAFVDKLISVGAQDVLIGGALLQSDYDTPGLYPDASYPTPGTFNKYVDKNTNNWRLADYYRRKRKNGEPMHPFGRYAPGGCVADMVRGFAFFGNDHINFNMSQVTYPDKVPMSADDVIDVEPRVVTFRKGTR